MSNDGATRIPLTHESPAQIPQQNGIKTILSKNESKHIKHAKNGGHAAMIYICPPDNQQLTRTINRDFKPSPFGLTPFYGVGLKK